MQLVVHMLRLITKLWQPRSPVETLDQAFRGLWLNICIARLVGVEHEVPTTL
jgi:hypothetical protein